MKRETRWASAHPEALRLAQERGYDLVEVAPMASPPVCRLLDYGQFKYEQARREKEARRHQRSVEFKEIRLKVKIGKGDFDTKVASCDPVPGGRRPGQGDGPVPGPRSQPRLPGPRPADALCGAGQRARDGRATAAARGAADVAGDHLDTQAKAQRKDEEQNERRRTRLASSRTGRSRSRQAEPASSRARARSVAARRDKRRRSEVGRSVENRCPR